MKTAARSLVMSFSPVRRSSSTVARLIHWWSKNLSLTVEQQPKSCFFSVATRRRYYHPTAGMAESVESSATASSPSVEMFHHSLSRSSLGLLDPYCPLIHPYLSTIQHLPEVGAALQEMTLPLSNHGRAAAALEVLQRGVNVFHAMYTTSTKTSGTDSENTTQAARSLCATWGLQAELQARLGLYDQAINTLRQIEDLLLLEEPTLNTTKRPSAKMMPHLFYSVVLARAKAHWLAGLFEVCQELCETIMEQLENQTVVAGMNPVHTFLYHASARTGHALARLLMVQNLDDVFTVRDPFRGILLSMEQQQPHVPALALVVAHVNMGVAEIVYGDMVSRTNQVEVPLDGAMRRWKQGLSLLQRQPTASSRDRPCRIVLQGTLCTNLAWGLLNMPQERDRVQRASEYAKEALQVYDSQERQGDGTVGGMTRDGWIRTLSVVASCYHQSGQAVTAEGLLTTALEEVPIATSPLDQWSRIYAMRTYADLCRDWERRQPEADRWSQRAEEAQQALPPGWQNKSVIHGSLWFWTPTLFTK